jgi:hypothetical protein
MMIVLFLINLPTAFVASFIGCLLMLMRAAFRTGEARDRRLRRAKKMQAAHQDKEDPLGGPLVPKVRDKKSMHVMASKDIICFEGDMLRRRYRSFFLV